MLFKVFALHVDLNEGIPLTSELLDASLLANTLHAITERVYLLNELHRVLRREGSVLFLEWASSFNNMGPTEMQAVPPAEAVRLFRSSGFTTGPMLPAGTHHYAFVATKM